MSDQIGFIISDLSRLMRRRFDERARRVGVTRAQWRTLTMLKRHEGINQGGLADLLEVEPITLCRMVDRLEEAGHVERRRDPADRRAWRIYLTPTSRPLLDRLRVIADDLFEQSLQGIGTDTQAQLTATLEQIRANLANPTTGTKPVMADADPNRDFVAAAVAPPIAVPVEPNPKRWRNRLLLISVPLLIALAGGYVWLTSGRFVSTDNAYVQQDKVSVSSDVAGRIVEVAARENQEVKAGDLLFRIDPDPYRIAVSQADAAIAGAQVAVVTLQSEAAGTSADITAARDAILSAQEDYARQNELMGRGFTTRARLQQAQHALQQARAQLANAQADAAEARAKLTTGAAVPGQNPQVAAAQVQRSKAMLDLTRTEVRAPVAGTVSQSDRLQVGQMMITGLPAVSIVANGRSWVEANFKETDLNKMRVGQPAEVSFDAYRGLKLRGHVQSIGAGTGSEFSVLPAQNANGNWVKVTQRVPVRIAIDEASPRTLIAGLSADVTVDVR